MMQPAARLVLIGLDSLNPDLARAWAAEGRMPTLQAAMARGLTATTESVPGFYTGATWPSFMTGVGPARHGIHAWKQLVPGTYDQVLTDLRRDMRRRPFWEALSAAGRNVAVLDVPLAPVSERLNGIQLGEWGAHDARHPFATWPPTLADDVTMRFGVHPVREACDRHRGPQDFVAFRDALMRGIAAKTALTRHFLGQGGWDFLAQVFTEGHCVGHQCWHLHDRSHPWHDESVARVAGDPMADVYQALDSAVGQAIEAADGATVMLWITHGMGPLVSRNFLLANLLIALAAAAPMQAETPAPPSRGALEAFLSAGWHALPRAARQALLPVGHAIRSRLAAPRPRPGLAIDPAASRCFVVENHTTTGAIRVNRIGREPAGKVAPGADFDRFCDDLARDLLDIVDLDTGNPAVARVLRTADVHSGEHLDLLPDLVVEWAEDRPASRMQLGSPKIGTVRGDYRWNRSGDHRAGGMLVVLGPGIEPGALGRTVSVVDLAPTIARALGVDLGEVDGRPVEEILAPIGVTS